MMLHHHTWCLFFLTAVISGSVHLTFDPDQPLKDWTYQPVLQPSEAVPPIGTYMLKTITGKICIKATMGTEYIVNEKKKTWYFNLEPSMVRTSGYCGEEAAVLCLTLPDNTTSLQFTFRKENDLFYVDKLTAHVSPLPFCPGCANKTYSGVLDHSKIFAAAHGRSFKCKSEKLLWMSSELSVKLIPLQIQAFTLHEGQYGKEEECWVDYNKRIIPIILGAAAVGLLLIALLTSLFIKDRRREGYEMFETGN